MPDGQRYQPAHAQEWLALMQRVQAQSPAWEAVYLTHPDFGAGIDLVFMDDNRMVGIFAGHYLAGQPGIYSIEILAVDPDLQGRGLGRDMIRQAWDLTPGARGFVFWTSDPRAARFYEKLGLHLHSRRRLARSALRIQNNSICQDWVVTEESDNGNLWEFVMTGKDIIR